MCTFFRRIFFREWALGGISYYMPARVSGEGCCWKAREQEIGHHTSLIIFIVIVHLKYENDSFSRR